MSSIDEPVTNLAALRELARELRGRLDARTTGDERTDRLLEQLLDGLDRMPARGSEEAPWLAESTATYPELAALILDSAQAIFLVLDPEGKIEHFNAYTAELLGYRLTEVKGCDWIEVFIPEYERERIRSVLADAAEGAERGRNINPIVTRARGERVIEWLYDSVEGFPGNDTRYIINVGHDVTERVRTEEALRASEQRLRLITDNIPAWVAYIDPQFRYQFNNARYMTWCDRRPDLLRGRHIAECLGEEAFDALRPQLATALGGLQVSFESRLADFQGRYRDIRTTYVPDVDAEGHVRGVYSLASDITDRRENERALQHSESRINAILRSAVEGIVLIDERGIVHSFNPAAEAMFGYSAREVIGQNVAMLMPEPDRSAHDGYLRRYLETGEAHIIGIGREVTGLRKDGSTFTVDLSVSEFQLGDVRWFTGVVRDITARKAAEQELRWLSAIVESSEDAIVGIGLDGKISSWNAGAERLYGYTDAEIVGRPLHCLSPEDRRSEVDRILEGLIQERGVQHFETVRRTKDGRPVEVSLALSPVRGDGGIVIGGAAIHRDVTEIRRAEREARQREEQLAHTDRLSTMGEMATGLAHELNQPLTAISNFAQAAITLSGRASDVPARLPEVLERIVGQSQRAGDIIRHLKEFAAKSTAEHRLADFNELVGHALSFVSRECSEADIRVEQDLDENLPIVRVDAVQIEQVLLNLLRNAIEAMHDGESSRLITVTTRRCDADTVEATVTDTGEGMDEATRSRIFDQFYTTKAHGMGMGLAISRSIVERHAGQLAVHSAPGEGTRFVVRLPASGE